MIRFKLFLRNAEEDIEGIFRSSLEDFKHNPRRLKSFYFSYIKFLENIRDVERPRKLLKEFEKKYPISILSKDELSLYYYLNGRSEYARGEFLIGLDQLSHAREELDKNDDQLKASILNTAANCFTDNLFFKEAMSIADKALHIREKHKLPERQETVSLMGGIHFKSANYEDALNSYLLAEELSKEFTLTNRHKNRLYNYIAKSSVMSGNYKKAETYLEKAIKDGDQKGFSSYIHLLLLLKQKKYDLMLDHFKEKTMLPENQREYDDFALGWSYTYMAEGAFLQEKYDDGIEYLYKAVTFFIEDLYFLEAQYVSLLLFRYSVPSNHIELFRNLEGNDTILSKLKVYVEKHASIRQTFFNDLFTNDDSDIGNSNLEQFYNDIKEINDINYNPEQVREIMDGICLY